MQIENSMNELFEEFSHSLQNDGPLKPINWSLDSDGVPQQYGFEIQNQQNVKENSTAEHSDLDLLSPNQKTNFFSQRNSTLQDHDLGLFGSDYISNSMEDTRKSMENTLLYVSNLPCVNNFNVINQSLDINNCNPLNNVANAKNYQESCSQGYRIRSNLSSVIQSPVTSYSMEEERSSQGSTSARQNIQNPRRNMPVLVAQKVISGCKDALNRSKNHGERYVYLFNIISRYFSTVDERKLFLKFLDDLEFGNKRTWQIIKNQLSDKNGYCVNALLESISAFLSEIGSVDFEAWLSSNKKMKPENKQILRDDKQWFKDQFENLLN